MRQPINNCLFFALRMWWDRGGYLCIRKSRHRHWFLRVHILWHPPEPHTHFTHFVPDKDDLGRFPPPLFRGYVKHGDQADAGRISNPE